MNRTALSDGRSAKCRDFRVDLGGGDGWRGLRGLGRVEHCRDVPGSRTTAWTYDTETAGREEARATSTMSNTNSDARVGEIHDQTRTYYISRLE